MRMDHLHVGIIRPHFLDNFRAKTPRKPMNTMKPFTATRSSWVFAMVYE
jgi:hypothetical protein